MKHETKQILLLVLLLLLLFSACTPAPKDSTPRTSTPAPSLTETNSPPVATEDPYLDIPPHPTNTTRPYSPFPNFDIYTETIDFPAWVSNPDIEVLLTNNGRFKDQDEIDLVLVDASTFETFQLPKIEYIVHYFWSPDGKEIIVLTEENDLITIDTTNGHVYVSPVGDRISISNSSGDAGMIVRSLKSNPQKYILLAPYEISRFYKSYDERYQMNHSASNDQALSIKNLETGENIQISTIDEGWHFHTSEWSPVDLSLASIQVDQYYNPWLDGFEETPNFKMQVFDIQGNIIAQYKNIPSINFSPDGTKFLFLPVDKESLVSWRSAPCIYDRPTDHTKCFNDAINKTRVVDGETAIFRLEWLQDQSQFAYNYYTYNSDSHESVGGLCYVEIRTGYERCILENFDYDYHKLANFEFSPNETAIAFIVNIAPRSDDGGMAQFGVANAQTGEYMLFPELAIFQEIWRP